MCCTLTGHSNQHRRFPPNLYNSWTQQWSLCATCVFLPANKHQKSYEDVFRRTLSLAVKLVNAFSAIVYADLETAIHIAVKNCVASL
jgi:hypothetical protein